MSSGAAFCTPMTLPPASPARAITRQMGGQAQRLGLAGRNGHLVHRGRPDRAPDVRPRVFLVDSGAGHLRCRLMSLKALELQPGRSASQNPRWHAAPVRGISCGCPLVASASSFGRSRPPDDSPSCRRLLVLKLQYLQPAHLRQPRAQSPTGDLQGCARRRRILAQLPQQSETALDTVAAIEAAQVSLTRGDGRPLAA